MTVSDHEILYHLFIQCIVKWLNELKTGHIPDVGNMVDKVYFNDIPIRMLLDIHL